MILRFFGAIILCFAVAADGYTQERTTKQPQQIMFPIGGKKTQQITVDENKDKNEDVQSTTQTTVTTVQHDDRTIIETEVVKKDVRNVDEYISIPKARKHDNKKDLRLLICRYQPGFYVVWRSQRNMKDIVRSTTRKIGVSNFTIVTDKLQEISKNNENVNLSVLPEDQLVQLLLAGKIDSVIVASTKASELLLDNQDLEYRDMSDRTECDDVDSRLQGQERSYFGEMLDSFLINFAAFFASV